VEKLKTSIRAKVEHPFRMIKQQFGFAKVCYRGLAKNSAQLVTLFSLSDQWMARRRLIQPGGGRLRRVNWARQAHATRLGVADRCLGLRDLIA